MKHIKIWWHDNEGVSNFGDLLGPYIAEKLTGKKAKFYPSSRWPWPKTYMIVGSILGAANRNCIVWGAGMIDRTDKIGKAKFLAVRGPITRDCLLKQGHKVPEIYGDPAILMNKLYSPKVEIKHEVGIIPHIVDYDKILKNNKYNYKIIDLRKSVEEVIIDIISCKRTISSSLHGLIISHTYQIPSIWMKFSDKLYGDDMKFYDYLSSVGLPNYKPVFPEEIPSPDGVLKTFDQVEYSIISESKLEHLQEKLMNSCPFL